VTLTVRDVANNSDTDSITITVLRDTDKDGRPDITDSDDDNGLWPDYIDVMPQNALITNVIVVVLTVLIIIVLLKILK